MDEVDKLAAKCLKSSQQRTSKFHSQSYSLQSKSVGLNALSLSVDHAYDSLTAIMKSLNEIEALLPPQDRLRPSDSIHKSHYPHLHHLLRSSSRSDKTASHNRSRSSSQSTKPSPSRVIGGPRRALSMSNMSSDKDSFSSTSSPRRSISTTITEPMLFWRPMNLPDDYPSPLIHFKSIAPNISTSLSPVTSRPVTVSPISEASDLDPSEFSGSMDKLRSIMER